MTSSPLPSSSGLHVFDSITQPMSFWTADHACFYANKAWLKLFSLPHSSPVLGSMHKILPLEQSCGTPSVEKLQGKLHKVLQKGQKSFPFTFAKHCGTPLACHVQCSTMEHENSTCVLMQATHMEPAQEQSLYEEEQERKKHAHIFQNHERMRLLLTHLPIGVDLWDKNFKLYDCNKASLRLFGVETKEEYLQKFKTFTPEFQPCGTRSTVLISKHLEIVVKQGHHTFEWMHIDATGKDVPVEIHVIRTKNEDNEDVAVVYYKDLRGEKLNIESINNTKHRLSRILDSAPYAITTWNDQMQLLDCNQATLKLFGFNSVEEYIQNFAQIIPPMQENGINTMENLHNKFVEAVQTGYSYSTGELVNPQNGKLIYADVTFKKLTLNGETRIIGYLTDLSLLHSLMKELQENQLELVNARDVAEKSAKVKGEFLANMSHEIRTPMNGILGLLHLLSYTDLQEQQKSYVDKIMYSAESLLRIINDILDFSKIEAGKLEMESVPFTLEKLQEELCTLFEPKFAEKSISGEIFKNVDVSTKLLGDPLRLKQVFLNLLGNAIKFTDHGSVSVAIDEVSKGDDNTITYVFRVQDSGIGLSQDQCSKLFSAFTQADTSTTRKYGGTGLGLIISKRIVEMMQGRIWVESEPGKGSAFRFTATFTLDMSQPTLEAPLIEVAEIPTECTKVGRILLVEDNPINQLIATELITHAGHNVDVAENGQEAIDKISQNTYDLVFMDIQMPIMDGLTATRYLRTQEVFKDLPIIAMSAHAMKGDKEISLSNGMNDHLAKPIQPQDLYNCIHFYLSKA